MQLEEKPRCKVFPPDRWNYRSLLYCRYFFASLTVSPSKSIYISRRV